ncbi:glycerate kinase [Thioalkalivibrio sp. K90mix]|uniref:glycerate kinase family protein n=1 Tax=unclassified Thioalkalivibrio TaxID=2621013 RepID=UPI000195A4AF|nr:MULTISPECIES: glycerate kinase [unclassified Thioalkalivibrio]ADC72092.1 glycerate kinase [Thioalkalivibrio sp. K90mix]
MLCPDSFKGSLDAADVAQAMARGVHAASPSTRIRALPMADGGEGTAELVSHTMGWAWHLSDVRDPRGQHVSAGWGCDAVTRRAVIDVASACGLGLVPEAERDPWRLDTRGVGHLILAALDAGARHVLIGLGGSGTVDGGAGMLHALGVRFRDREGAELDPVPDRLEHLESADFSGLEPRLAGLRITVLNDVDNPLTGNRGAAAVFGPQKGLATKDVPRMDAYMERLERAIDEAGELRRPGAMPGAGAAGGLGFALACVLRGQSRMGAVYLADLIDLDAAIAGSDLVITGEGQVDGQTAHGKVVAEVVRRARRCCVPVVAVAGSIDATPEELEAVGLADARALCDGTITLEQAMGEPGRWIMERTRALVEARGARSV